jgi:three-Cys-motif partner protein
MATDKAYEGREHSAVKHALLKGYLEKMLFVKGVSGTQEITYVDCFAGPYQDESKDIQATSIAISLKTLKKVRDALAAQRKYVTMRAIYVEKDEARYNRLKAYLDSSCPSGIKPFYLHGDYSEKADEILSLCGNNSFVFFFIDQEGWTDVSIPRLDKLLRRQKSEFLVTFMYDFFMRFVGKPGLRNRVTEMLGPLNDDEYQEMCQLQSKEREKFIVRRYREQLMAAMGPDSQNRARSYHAVIKDKDKERTKYHLVYGTRHPTGIIKFAEQTDKAELIERVVRIQAKQNSSNQIAMFSAEDEADRMLDGTVDLEVVKHYWLTKFTDQPVKFNEAMQADMLEETGWLIRDFELAFKELLAEKKVENLDAKNKRPKRPIHFDEGERLRRCV